MNFPSKTAIIFIVGLTLVGYVVVSAEDPADSSKSENVEPMRSEDVGESRKSSDLEYKAPKGSGNAGPDSSESKMGTRNLLKKGKKPKRTTRKPKNSSKPDSESEDKLEHESTSKPNSESTKKPDHEMTDKPDHQSTGKPEAGSQKKLASSGFDLNEKDSDDYDSMKTEVTKSVESKDKDSIKKEISKIQNYFELMAKAKEAFEQWWLAHIEDKTISEHRTYDFARFIRGKVDLIFKDIESSSLARITDSRAKLKQPAVEIQTKFPDYERLM